MTEEKYQWDKVQQWEEELGILTDILSRTRLTATVKWGAPMYTYQNRNVLGIGGFKNYFAIWFLNGVFLKDELNVLVNANEGVTKSLRQWRFTDASQIKEKQILAYVDEAISVEEQGKVIKPEPRSFPVPAILEAALEKDALFREAFEALSRGKRNDYLEYIGEAKQEKTQLARIEKIRPMVLEGIGLNDKYRK